MKTAGLSVASERFQLTIPRADVQNFWAAVRSISSSVRQLVSDQWLLYLPALAWASSVSGHCAIGPFVASVWTPSVPQSAAGQSGGVRHARPATGDVRTNRARCEGMR